MTVTLPCLWTCPACASANAPAVARCRCGKVRPVYGLKDERAKGQPSKPPAKRAATRKIRAKGEHEGEFVESFGKLLGIERDSDNG